MCTFRGLQPQRGLKIQLKNNEKMQQAFHIRSRYKWLFFCTKLYTILYVLIIDTMIIPIYYYTIIITTFIENARNLLL